MLLTLGSTGPDVRAAIEQLQRVGFPLPDGEVYTAQVKACVWVFQRDRGGLKPDGVIGNQTWPALVAAPDRKPGSWRKNDKTGPWWSRVESLLAFEAPSHDGPPGYYGNKVSDRTLAKMAPSDRLIVDFIPPAKRGKVYPSKIGTGTCGHRAGKLAWCAIGDQDGKPGATNANYTKSWESRADKWEDIHPRSSAAIALLDGDKIIMNLEKREGDKVAKLYPYKCKGYAQLFGHASGCSLLSVPSKLDFMEDCDGGLAIVEMASHVVSAIVVTETSGLIDPWTLLPMRPGTYLDNATGTSSAKNLGKPHVFREFLPDEPGQCIHIWTLPAGTEAQNAVQWRARCI